MPTLTIGKTAIPYTIRRSDRAKRQRIVVTPDAVDVVAPVGHSAQRIEAFVHRRRRWVYDEREKMRELLAASPWPDHFVTGAKIPYRGRRMRLTVLEYAVVHELCHLKHRHRSTPFWTRVKSLLPDYESKKAWLEHHGAGFDL